MPNPGGHFHQAPGLLDGLGQMVGYLDRAHKTTKAVHVAGTEIQRQIFPGRYR